MDINGDGKPDLLYAPPVQKRPGMEKAVYLTFISNQEEGYTSMFSVLPEQYNRGVYPSGIIGVNPAGKFIVSKYEGTSGSRSVVRGVVYGDYVLDNTTGTYQRVIRASIGRSARTLDEGDLESGPTADSFYFAEIEFNEIITPLALYQKLPASIQSRIQDPVNDNATALAGLNQLLKERDLVKTIAQDTGEVLEAEVAAFVADTSSLSELELVALNRLYLGHKYPDVCPQKDGGTNDITEILPLFSVTLGSTDDDISSETNRAVSYADYKSQKATLQAKFDSYKKVSIVKKKYKELLEYVTQNEVIADYISDYGLEFGIKGSFSITFSNVNASFDSALCLMAENIFALKDNYNKSLIGGVKNVSVKAPVPLGPITINLILKTTMDIPLSIGGSASFSSNMFCGYAGLYGAWFRIGADYGVSWVKWFKVFRRWVYRPDVYFNPYGSGNFVNETVCYAGPQDTNIQPASGVFNGANASISLYPNFTTGLGIGVSVLQATLEGEAGLLSQINLAVHDKIKMTTSVDYVQKAKLVPAISVTLPFGLGDRDYSCPIELISLKQNIYSDEKEY